MIYRGANTQTLAIKRGARFGLKDGKRTLRMSRERDVIHKRVDRLFNNEHQHLNEPYTCSMFIQLTLCLSYKFKDSFLFVFYIGSVRSMSMPFAAQQINNEFGLCCCCFLQLPHIFTGVPFVILYYGCSNSCVEYTTLCIIILVKVNTK